MHNMKSYENTPVYISNRRVIFGKEKYIEQNNFISLINNHGKKSFHG